MSTSTSQALDVLREVVLDASIDRPLRAKALEVLIGSEVQPAVADSIVQAGLTSRALPWSVVQQLPNRKIDAIKKLRELRPALGLLQAKNVVDALQAAGRIHFPPPF